jgi:hypothetical protein
MSDQAPIDLQALDPGEPPDLVSDAVRRFRVRVVLFTVVAIVGAVALTIWAVTAVLHSRDHFEREDLLSAPQWAVAEDLVGRSCATPTYNVGTIDVTLLQAAPMPGGGWALHLVLDGNGSPLVVERNTSDGGSFASWTTLVPPAGGLQGRVTGQPGVTWGEAYVSAPQSAGDLIAIKVLDPHHEDAGTFTVALDQVLCAP